MSKATAVQPSATITELVALLWGTGEKTVSIRDANAAILRKIVVSIVGHDTLEAAKADVSSVHANIRAGIRAKMSAKERAEYDSFASVPAEKRPLTAKGTPMSVDQMRVLAADDGELSENVEIAVYALRNYVPRAGEANVIVKAAFLAPDMMDAALSAFLTGDEIDGRKATAKFLLDLAKSIVDTGKESAEGTEGSTEGNSEQDINEYIVQQLTVIYQHASKVGAGKAALDAMRKFAASHK